MGAPLTGPPGSIDLRAQMREEDHIADGGGIGEEHDESIDTNTQAPRRGHAVLQGAHVIGVVEHGLFVTLVLAGYLGPETRRLIFGIVELREAVGNLAS